MPSLTTIGIDDSHINVCHLLLDIYCTHYCSLKQTLTQNNTYKQMVYQYIYVCIAAPIFRKSKCKTFDDCGLKDVTCMDGICLCLSGDEYISEDKTQCTRKNNKLSMFYVDTCT